MAGKGVFMTEASPRHEVGPRAPHSFSTPTGLIVSERRLEDPVPADTLASILKSLTVSEADKAFIKSKEVSIGELLKFLKLKPRLIDIDRSIYEIDTECKDFCTDLHIDLIDSVARLTRSLFCTKEAMEEAVKSLSRFKEVMGNGRKFTDDLIDHLHNRCHPECSFCTTTP